MKQEASEMGPLARFKTNPPSQWWRNPPTPKGSTRELYLGPKKTSHQIAEVSMSGELFRNIPVPNRWAVIVIEYSLTGKGMTQT